VLATCLKPVWIYVEKTVVEKKLIGIAGSTVKTFQL